jgi:hypothetical protein
VRRVSLVTAAILSAAVLGPPASASYDPLGSGTANLVLDKRFATFLEKDGIELKASAGARRKGQQLLLPVSGGQIDPTAGRGEAETKGTLLFQSRARKVPLRRIRVKSTREPLIAKVGGSQLKLATAKKTSSKRAGFGTKLTSTRLALTAKLVTRLNKKLRPKVPFEAGQPLGTLIVNAQPQLIAIEETGTATISLDAGFVSKLDARFVSLNPVSPAQRFGLQATFPISVGGAIAPDGSQGTLRTGGALEFLQLGAGQVFWSELWLDLGARSDTAELDVEPTPTFPGKIGRAGVLTYLPAPVSSDPRTRTISVAGARLTLSVQAAQTFNEAFAQGEGSVFEAGETVGSLSFSAQGQ